MSWLSGLWGKWPTLYRQHFLNKKIHILISISPKFVVKCPIDSHSRLVQVMAQCHQAASLYLDQGWERSRCSGASPSHNELISSCVAEMIVKCEPQWLKNSKLTVNDFETLMWHVGVRHLVLLAAVNNLHNIILIQGSTYKKNYLPI